MSARRNLTQIPPDVDYYPIETVLNILRIVAAERDELFAALQNEQAKSATAAAAAYPPPEAFGFPFADTNDTAITAAPPPVEENVPSTFKVDAIKKRIAKKSFLLVKKTPHNKAKKPFTELNEAVPNEACAMALFEDFAPKSDTNRLTKWELTGDQVIQWLHSNSNNNSNNSSATNNKQRYIHPVKFDGKVISFGGSKPFVYAWAAYESLQAKFDKKGASLSLKFRTKMIGSGRPEEGSDSPPSFS